MPRANQQGGQRTPAQDQRHLLWEMTGTTPGETLDTWDPKAELLVSAILTVIASGATLVIRPGSGGRTIGLAIWEGDHRHPPTWVYEAEELDNWSVGIMAVAAGRVGLGRQQ